MSVPGVTRWRRKTAETEAVQWTGENLEAIRKFAGIGSFMADEDGTLRILVSSGWRRLVIGCWVGREDRALFVDTEQGFAYNYEPVPDPLVMPADEFAAVKTVYERLEAAGGTHRPGPLRMVARRSVPGECLSCGQRWPCEGSWQARAEAAEAKLAAIREVLTMSLTDTGDELGVLERPADDSAMLDRALRLINCLLAVIGTEEPGDA